MSWLYVELKKKKAKKKHSQSGLEGFVAFHLT